MSPRVRPTHPLLALSSAAVVAVYTAGYLKTRAVAARFSEAPAMPRPAAVSATGPVVEAPSPHDAVVTPPATSAAPPVSPKPRKARTEKVESQPTGENTPTTATADRHDVVSVAIDRGSLDVTAATSIMTIAPPPTPTSEAMAPKSTWRDGTYSGWGSSRHGDIQATIVVEAGRITSARIAQCLTRYSCSWIAHLQGQVVDRQSADVDYVSGATQSSNAFYWAIVDALSKASAK